MKWIQNISLTLKTWVFKKKILKFSSKFSKDPQACFYCPEMCRFACPVSETLQKNTVTPRAKMSLLHLDERKISRELVTGDLKIWDWVISQCTGCGLCTEYCVHEIDVASNLRQARQKRSDELSETSKDVNVFSNCISGVVLLAQRSRVSWWKSHPELLTRLGVDLVLSDENTNVKKWLQGNLDFNSCQQIAERFSKTKTMWIESAETAWFFAKGLKQEHRLLSHLNLKLVWCEFYKDLASKDPDLNNYFHESYYLSRLLPRLGYSVPIYEKGVMPFHSGWNVWDCGGEGAFKDSEMVASQQMKKRFLNDLSLGRNKPMKIICQSLECSEHLQAEVKTSYWLDEVFS